MVGVSSSAGPLRLYLAGPLCVEWAGRVLTERDLPRRQGRVLLAFLACERSRPVSRDALAELLWPEHAPPSWETSLKALVSKLRTLTSALVETALEAVRLDALREPSWRLLMRGHEALGNRPEALAAFHRLRARLREDLGVAPSAQTQVLFDRILRGAPAPRRDRL